MGEPFQLSSEQLRRLSRYDTPTIANAMESLGIAGMPSLGPAIRPLAPFGEPMVGIAVTATMREMRGGKFDHLEGWLRFLETIEAATLPVVAVYQDSSLTAGREAMIGEGMSLAMSACGAVGAVVDGCCRDIEALRKMEFPVLARGLTADRGRIRFHNYQVPVEVGGMKVCPGDLIHADENGALVLPADHLEEIVAAAESVAAKEEQVFRLLRSDDFRVARLREWYREPLAAAERDKSTTPEFGPAS